MRAPLAGHPGDRGAEAPLIPVSVHASRKRRLTLARCSALLGA